MGAYILDESRYGQFLAAGASAHLVPPLKHGRLEARPLKITGNDGCVVSTPYYDCIILPIWHIDLLNSLDLNTSYNNPSLLKPDMRNQLAINYVGYFAGVNYGYAAYSFGTPLPGNFAIGMHYINYGNFIEALPSGEKTGATFNAAEYALNIIWSNKYKQFTFGINLKPILSAFESYQSIGFAADLGISHFSKNQNTVVAMVARNIGTQITTY